MNRLWADVRACFEYDDGSLPSIEVNNLSVAGVSAVYSMLRGRSRLCGEPASFWSRVSESSVLVDTVPDAAALVTSGEADAFHHCIEGVVVCGVELPVLGLFVGEDGVEIDYRMGDAWGPAQVAGFFELLRDMCALDPDAVVTPAEREGPPDREGFLRAWSSFQNRPC